MPVVKHTSTNRHKGPRQVFLNKAKFVPNKYTPEMKVHESFLQFKTSLCCSRCCDVINWKVDYAKYQALQRVRRCNICQQKSVNIAYHKICQLCASENVLCAKCQKPPFFWRDNGGGSDEEGSEETGSEEEGGRVNRPVQLSEGASSSPQSQKAAATSKPTPKAPESDEDDSDEDDDDSAEEGDEEDDEDDEFDDDSENWDDTSSEDDSKARKVGKDSKKGGKKGKKSADRSGSSENAVASGPLSYEDPPALKRLNGLDVTILRRQYRAEVKQKNLDGLSRLRERERRSILRQQRTTSAEQGDGVEDDLELSD